MSAQRLLTVVIPVWDRYCGFLAECVQSVLAQDVALRVLVVDNCSRAPLPALPDGVEVIRTRDRVSAGAARNAGLALVDTPYVVFCDADDKVLPGTFRFCIERLQDRPDVVACATAQLTWDPESGSTRPFAFPREHVYRLSGRRRLLALYQLGRSALQLAGATVMRTDDARAAGGFGDSNLGEDWVLATALALRGPIELHRRPGPLCRVHGASLLAAGDARALHRCLRELRGRVRMTPSAPLVTRLALPLLPLAHALKTGVQAAAWARR